MSTSLIGRVLLNQFRVDAFIAAGGMGAVYKAWDLKRQVPLAMKVLHADLAEDPDILKRFKREAAALKKLAHPNIVPFYGLYQTEDFAFLLEGFVDGTTLKAVLKRKGRLNPTEALTVLKGVSAALSYAHTHGVVHCDVKPGNVMLDRGGHVYLTDFGIARHAESTTTTFGPAGTPAYMAPEQILGKAVTPATDVYALGVMAYELLTGRRPFTGEEQGLGTTASTRSERLRLAHVKIPPPDPRRFNPHLPAPAAAVLLKALAKQPQNRYPHAWAFFEALCAGMGTHPNAVAERWTMPPMPPASPSDPPQPPAGTTGTIPPPPPPTTPPYPSRRPQAMPPLLKWGVLAAGALMLLTTAGLLLALIRHPLAPTPKTPLASPQTSPIIAEASDTPGGATESTPVPPTPTTSPPPSPTPSGPQGHVVFEYFRHTGNVDIYIVNADGEDMRPLLTGRANERYPDLSPNGRYVAYAADPDGTWDIYVLDTLTGTSRQMTSWGKMEWYPSWSPDGKYIVFASNEKRGGNDHDLYILSWPEGKIYPLTSGAGVDNLPDWSPDGQWIAFQRETGGEWWICVIHPDGTGFQQLVLGKTPAWSPDGTRILFSAGDTSRDVYVYNFQNKTVTPLTHDNATNRDPCWSTDGRYVFFESNRSGGWGIFRMKANGEDITRITPSGYDAMTAGCGP